MATLAQLNYPNGVAVDASGNIFIADRHNHRVRRIGTDGIITTVAGTGTGGYSGDGGAATSAQLYYPWDVAVDAGGVIFVTDNWNNRVRRIDVDGTISTFAGIGPTYPLEGSFSGGGGPAICRRCSCL